MYQDIKLGGGSYAVSYTHLHDLFDRCREDEAFLEVRLGIGKREAERKIEYKKQEHLEVEDELQNVPKEMHDQYKYISETPIVCSLNQVNAVGIIGKKTERFEIMQGMILDICLLYTSRIYQNEKKSKTSNPKYWWCPGALSIAMFYGQHYQIVNMFGIDRFTEEYKKEITIALMKVDLFFVLGYWMAYPYKKNK